MVTFVAQCEKKALNKSRRVLDAFANRIGNRTWQTVITNEGLHAVKKLLRKTVTKNTAVSCFWMRSRSRSELVWIVGNRRKFNLEGCVPVNSTQKDIIKNQWENDWHYLPLIKSLTAISALFHDWGKSSDFFQARLLGKEKLAPRCSTWVIELNRGEGRHSVARIICHGQRGEIRKRYREGQEDQLGALGLVTNAVVLWNIIYMQEALDHTRQTMEIKEEDENRLSPLGYGHINVLGHYSFTLAEQIMKGQLRPLKQPSDDD